MSDDPAGEVLKVSAWIRGLLAGLEPEKQGAILADLLLLWLAGHAVLDHHGAIERIETFALRETLLSLHCEKVRELIPASEQQILEDNG